MPQAASRLALLIKLLDVTGYDLATTLGIDPSLISKWKRKRRKIPGRTDVMPKIAGYLLDIDARRGSRTVIPLLNAMAGGSVLSREQAIELLTQWLLDPSPAEWYNGDQKAVQVRLAQDSYTCPIEVFLGVTGRRQAVLRLLNKVSTLPSDRQLLIISQEGLDWIDGDAEFLGEFKRLLAGWTATGHALDVIHWVERSPDHLQSLIQHLLPLHLDVKINSWYCPMSDESSLPLTCLIVPGEMALVGSNIDPSGERHTILYSDQATIRQFEWIFQSLKSGCIRLIDYFQAENIPLLINIFTDNQLRSGNQMISIQSRLPLLFFLPLVSLSRLLAENGITGSQQANMIGQWSVFDDASNLGQLSSRKIRIIHHMGAIEQVLKQQTFTDPILSALTGQPILVGRHYFHEYLQHLSDAVLTGKSLEVALIRSETYNRSSWPNQLIISNGLWAAWGIRLNQNKLFTQEPTLVYAFDKYFQERWQMIPRINRDRQTVSRCLSDLAGNIDKQN